ncbi:MAG: GerMN domain-containing protein [Acidimicrobiales bacterium]
MTESRPPRSRHRDRLIARWRLTTVLAAVGAIATVVAVLIAGLSLGGFGVPTDGSPRLINSNSVPFGLLVKTSPPSPPSSGHKGHPPQSAVSLYFIGQSGQLVPVPALINRPVTLLSQLNELLTGPGNPALGAPADVQTAIPDGTQVLTAKVSNGLATVDLTPDIEGASGEQLIQAIAQLVFTATTATTCPSASKIHAKELPGTTTTTAPPGTTVSLPCADRVVFQVNGQPQQVPTSTGVQTSKAVTRLNYLSLNSLG